MNPVLIVTHNNLALTKRCVESVRNQDISTSLIIVDNGSNRETEEWLWQECNERDEFVQFEDNRGVSYAWNYGLDLAFRLNECDWCLVLNNDTVIPRYFYGELLAYNAGFISGAEKDKLNALPEYPPASEPVIHAPQFSAFLIRRETWQKIGPFDEGMKFYAQDCDYHIRATQLGIPLLCAPGVPYYHERSSTLLLAPPWERSEIQLQADRDRMYFLHKYGFAVGSAEYQRATAPSVSDGDRHYQIRSHR